MGYGDYARHEAGHAVANWLFGGDSEVEIPKPGHTLEHLVTGERLLGRMKPINHYQPLYRIDFIRRGYESPPAPRQWKVVLLPKMIVIFAGCAAEHLLNPESWSLESINSNGGDGDIRQAHELIIAGTGGRICIDSVMGHGAVHYMEESFRLSRKLMGERRVIDAVDSVAKYLIDRRFLQSQDVREKAAAAFRCDPMLRYPILELPKPWKSRFRYMQEMGS